MTVGSGVASAGKSGGLIVGTGTSMVGSGSINVMVGDASAGAGGKHSIFSWK